jgi:sigma-54 specific flagellar transcriptional regulator A
VNNAIALSPAATATPPAPAASHRVRLPTGRSPAIQEVVRLLHQVARHDSTVLVLGESGTGKEVVARAIHELSGRRRGPFVAVNCGAIPAELLESELFGHEKGAFTGAYTQRKGRFELAEGGTLFLDEIGDMSLPMQVKLLRVLQERVYERVGSGQAMGCDVRIVAATHRNLEEAITRGQFRGDLFYRLNVFPIDMPALRERREDLGTLIEEFVAQNVAAGRDAVSFTPAALAALAEHPWPGNVRELSNLVERISILHGGCRVDAGALPPRYRPAGVAPCASEPQPAIVAPLPLPRQARPALPLPGSDDADEDRGLTAAEALDLLERGVAPAPLASDRSATPHGEGGLAELPETGLDLRAHLNDIEFRLIGQALERAGGTVAHAARLLGLRRTTLVEKLRKFGFATSESVTES